jgi:RNA polymerase sigma factor (TIGR02999 family)
VVPSHCGAKKNREAFDLTLPLGYNPSVDPSNRRWRDPLMSDVTRILTAIERGEPGAAAQLLPLVYDELRRLAAHKMRQEKPGHTLQATALVHEAYIRLLGSGTVGSWTSRAHFYAAAAEAMRRILIDSARRKHAQKNGGDRRRVELAAIDLLAGTEPDRLFLLDDALEKLAKEDSVAAEMAKLHVFAGLSISESAELLGISRATGYRSWTYARAWLRAEMEESDTSH